MSNKTVLESGYDIPVYGLENGEFVSLHAFALVCITLSFFSVVAVLFASFTKNTKDFFKWPKSDRFIVYIAICDGLFNVAHSMDHTHVLATNDHVRPPGLCAFYGFILAIFLTAENVMVSIVAINAFCLMFFNKDLPFGKYDYRLLLITFGGPFIAAAIAVGLGQFGPNGVFCFMDAIKGATMNIVFLTIPLLVTFFGIAILYGLIWYRLNAKTRNLRTVNGEMISTRTRLVVRNMSLFLLAFFVQWWAAAVFGAWSLSPQLPPIIMFRFLTTFTNIGGCLNGIVYVIIRHRKTKRRDSNQTVVHKNSVDKTTDSSKSTTQI